MNIETNIDLETLIDASNFMNGNLNKNNNASSVAAAINAKKLRD